jgi:hypothetical protein
MSTMPNERFSGHESFVCRYGWLPKVHRAIQNLPTIIKDEESAMQALGIGRNMVTCRAKFHDEPLKLLFNFRKD